MGGNECGLGLGHTNNCPTSDQVGYDRSTWSLDVYWKVRFLLADSLLPDPVHPALLSRHQVLLFVSDRIEHCYTPFRVTFMHRRWQSHIGNCTPRMRTSLHRFVQALRSATHTITILSLALCCLNHCRNATRIFPSCIE